MITLTKAQRLSLKRIYERHIGSIVEGGKTDHRTYRQFRKTVQPELCGYGAVMVQVPGMWIGIETDGYAHT